MLLRRYTLAVTLALILGLLLSGEQTALPQTGLQVGVFLPTGDAQAISDFEAMVGRHQDIIMYYQAWADQSGRLAFEAARVQAVINRGSIPMVTWEPWQWGGERREPA